jgi:uncharacterized protein with HEPN domain
MHRDRAVLTDIYNAATLALEFRGKAEKAVFLKDKKTQSAVLHQLIIIGEAVKRLSSAFSAAHPEVPWRLIAGMRDRLIHSYNVVDFEEVWNATERDIPELIKRLESYLADGGR